MSLVLPTSSAQRAAWSRRDKLGWEPVRLQLDGWQANPDGEPGLLNERVWVLRRGDSTITLIRSWDSPLTAGHPMVVASTRSVTAPNQTTFQVKRTSMFDGREQMVDVVYLAGKDWHVRIVFNRCSAEAVDAALVGLLLPAT